MKETKELGELMKDQASVPAPDFDKMWVNIQNQSGKKKKKFNTKLLIPAALTFLAFTVATTTNAEKILDFFEVKVGDEQVIVENKDSSEKVKPEGVRELMENFDISQSKEILGFVPVQPSYLPEQYKFSYGEGISGIPTYNSEGKLLSIATDSPSYIFKYRKGDKDEDILNVSYDVNFISTNSDLLEQHIPRENPQSIELMGLEGATHDYGIFVLKPLDDRSRVIIEVLALSKLPREESIKIMESILKQDLK